MCAHVLRMKGVPVPKRELLATFKWKLLYISYIVVTEVLTGLSSRWSCRYKVCGQRNFTERKTATARGISVACPDFFLTPSLILMLWACWLFHFFFGSFQEQEKKRKQKEEAKRKLEAEKVSNNDFHLVVNFITRRSPVVSDKFAFIYIILYFFLFFFRQQKKPKLEFLLGKCLSTKQTNILNLMSRSESLNKLFLSFQKKLRHYWSFDTLKYF